MALRPSQRRGGAGPLEDLSEVRGCAGMLAAGGCERLSCRAFAAMWNDCVDHEPTGQLLAAWIAKEELRALLATAARGGQRHDIATG